MSRRDRPKKIHKCVCGGSRATSMLVCRLCWKAVPKAMRREFTHTATSDHGRRLVLARGIIQHLRDHPRPNQHLADPKPWPAWFPAALDEARIIDAANASPPPCPECGTPGSESAGGNGRKRRCALVGCAHEFDIVQIVQAIRHAETLPEASPDLYDDQRPEFWPPAP